MGLSLNLIFVIFQTVFLLAKSQFAPTVLTNNNGALPGRAHVYINPRDPYTYYVYDPFVGYKPIPASYNWVKNSLGLPTGNMHPPLTSGTSNALWYGGFPGGYAAGGGDASRPPAGAAASGSGGTAAPPPPAKKKKPWEFIEKRLSVSNGICDNCVYV